LRGGFCQAGAAARLGGAQCITGITLIAGLASTVGRPLTAWMETQIGWRGACLVSGPACTCCWACR